MLTPEESNIYNPGFQSGEIGKREKRFGVYFWYKNYDKSDKYRVNKLESNQIKFENNQLIIEVKKTSFYYSDFVIRIGYFVFVIANYFFSNYYVKWKW